MNPPNAETDIRTLVARFADGATRNDPAAFRALWTPQCEWNIGEPFPMAVRGVEEVVRAFAGLMSQWEFFAHFPHAVLVEVRGDEAHTRCTVEEIGVNTKAGKSYHNVALYLDELRRVDGRWLFQSRSYHYLWLDDRPIGGQTFPAPPLPAWASAAASS